MAAIYAIWNTTSEKVYIGGTEKRAADRFEEHWTELRHGRHHNCHLQSAWNRDGEDAFDFFPLFVWDCDDWHIIGEVEGCFFDAAVSELGRSNVYTFVRGGESPMKNPEVAVKMGATRKEKFATDPEFAVRALAGLYNRSPEAKANQNAASVEANAKHYVFRDPDGNRVEVYNLRAFCRGNGLNQGTMCLVALGERTHHKGWRAHT